MLPKPLVGYLRDVENGQISINVLTSILQCLSNGKRPAGGHGGSPPVIPATLGGCSGWPELRSVRSAQATQRYPVYGKNKKLSGCGGAHL